MIPLKFESCLAKTIQRLISLRQIGGADYQAQARLLLYFDHFLVDQKLVEPHLNQHLIEAYEKTLSHLVPRGRTNRMCVVRQLCEYLCRSDPQTYVPETLRTPSSHDTFVPYIFSAIDVQDLMTAAASLPPVGALRGLTYQTLLGLLYCTGLRIGEAMALKLTDFHSQDDRLYIAEGKFRKARWVPLSPTTTQALSRYVRQRLQTGSHRSPDSPLFLNQRGHCLKHCTVSHTFHRLLQQCGIRGRCRRPRLHDLRHSFAVQRLLAWYHDGKDINTRLTWLATYMGHVDIRATQVYLHPTAELLEQVNDRFHHHYLQQVSTQGATS